MMNALEEDALRLLFENSPDAAWLLDTESFLYTDCNAAAVVMMRARDKSQLLQKGPADFSPELQPDGSRSSDRARQLLQ